MKTWRVTVTEKGIRFDRRYRFTTRYTLMLLAIDALEKERDQFMSGHIERTGQARAGS